MERYGSELIFISVIGGTGETITLCDKPPGELMNKEVFKLNRLSLSNHTFIASGFNTYVVKLKNDPYAKTNQQN